MVVPNDIDGAVMLGVDGWVTLSPFQTIIVYGNRRRPEGVGRAAAADVPDIAAFGAGKAGRRSWIHRVVGIDDMRTSARVYCKRWEHAPPPTFIEKERPQEERQLEGVRCSDHHGIERRSVI